MAKRNSQLKLLKDQNKAFGGELLKKRKGRLYGRPLDTRRSMHLVLRSSYAYLDWSFRSSKNSAAIKSILKKFSIRYGVQVLSVANVGNHLHLQIKLSNRYTYPKFIRAVTAAIAMAVTGASRWQPLEKVLKNRSEELQVLGAQLKSEQPRFWDYRPFSRVIVGFRALLTLKDYIQINKLEGQGFRRNVAQLMIYVAQNKGLSSA